MKFYTLGYTGRKPEQLKKLIEETPNSILVDIRFEARSRVSYWNSGALQNLLGKRYTRVPQLGNLNYLGTGGIRIAKPELGLQIVTHLPFDNIFLMCACEYEHGCHRKVVADMLRERGFVVSEAVWPNQPKLALSIMQPWAWLIIEGYKSIENRDWLTHYRGEFYIHAGIRFDADGADFIRHKVPGLILPDFRKDFANGSARSGGILGKANLTDCVTQSRDPWFFGYYGFVLKDVQSIPFYPLAGKQKFFAVPELEMVAA